MNNISKVACLIQIYIGAFIGIICLGVFGGIIAARFGFNGCVAQADTLDAYSFIWLAVGAACLFWIGKNILFPTIKNSVSRRNRFAGEPELNQFCSTHPSYALLDLLLIPPFYLIYSIAANDARCSFLQEHYRGLIVIFIALALPAFRLFSWYGLGRQNADTDASRSAPQALVPLFMIIAPFAAVLAVLYIQTFTIPQMRAPVVDGKTFVGGLPEHPEFRDKVVRLKGIQKTEPFECNKFNGEFACASVLVDLAEGGEALVRVCGIEQQDLVKRASGRVGKPFEAFGKIVTINAREKDLCGLDTLGNPPVAGRYLLAVEYP